MVKIFAYEYGSAGGMFSRAMRHPLMYQGDFMLRALISDLADLPGVEVSTVRDLRLPVLDIPPTVSIIACDGQSDHGVNECMRNAQAVWPVAPECGGILHRLSQRIVRSRRILLGSRTTAVRIASSRLLTTRVLSRADVPVVDTYLPDDSLPEEVEAWVAKPDDGVGFNTTHIFHSIRDAREWIAESGSCTYVLQPFLHGKPCSVTLLCGGSGNAHVLSCDEQRFAVRNNQFHYLGTSVNSIAGISDGCQDLAARIARAIPGLWGYVAVDFILTADGPVVLGIYPRLTTSYAGLRASIGCNPASLVLGLLEKAGAPPPTLSRTVVDVDAQTFMAQGGA